MQPNGGRRRAAIIVALAVAAGMLALSAPRAMAAFGGLWGDRTATMLARGKPVDAAALKALVVSRQAALRWADSPAAWNESGRALLRLGIDLGPVPDRAHVDEGIDRLRQGLMRSPLSTVAWIQLARGLHVRDRRTTPETVRALAMSILTDPHRKDLAPMRLRLGLDGWPALDSRDRELVQRQARYLWSVDRARFMTLAGTPARSALLRLALLPDIKALAEFEKRLRTKTGK